MATIPWNNLRQVTGWLFQKIADSVVVGSRVRLARNFRGFPFPHQATMEQSKELVQKVVHALQEYKKEDICIIDVATLSEVEKAVLVEQHLISLEFAIEDYPKVAIVLPGKRLSIMINEEDHVRLQGFASGLALKSLWKKVNVLDDCLDRKMEVAFHPVMGYLTACPSNLGSGFRASVLMHLPGLVFTRRHKLIFPLLEDMGISIRGWYGEGSLPAANLYQISSGPNLGKGEEEIIHELQIVVQLLSKEERKMRQQMGNSRRWRDLVKEILRKIKTARQLSTNQALSFLSFLSLAAELKMVDWDRKNFGRLFSGVLPGHLQHSYGSSFPPARRDIIRAKLMRSQLGEIYV